MRRIFINTLIDLARKDKDIVLITPDMGFSVLEPFFEEFPERSINCGTKRGVNCLRIGING